MNIHLSQLPRFGASQATHKHKHPKAQNLVLQVSARSTVKNAPLPIVVLPSVSHDKVFTASVVHALQHYPRQWIKQLQDAGYQIIIGQTVTDGLKSLGVDLLPFFEKLIDGMQGLCCHKEDDGRCPIYRNVIFLANPVWTKMAPYLHGTVNHELNHAFIWLNRLLHDADLQKAYFEDVVALQAKINRHELSQAEIDSLEDLMMNMKSVKYASDLTRNSFTIAPFDEAMTDTLAWLLKGGGAIGNGAPGGTILKPNLIVSSFPRLADVLKRNVLKQKS